QQVVHRFIFHCQAVQLNDAQKLLARFPNLPLLQLHPPARYVPGRQEQCRIGPLIPGALAKRRTAPAPRATQGSTPGGRDQTPAAESGAAIAGGAAGDPGKSAWCTRGPLSNSLPSRRNSSRVTV